MLDRDVRVPFTIISHTLPLPLSLPSYTVRPSHIVYVSLEVSELVAGEVFVPMPCLPSAACTFPRSLVPVGCVGGGWGWYKRTKPPPLRSPPHESDHKRGRGLPPKLRYKESCRKPRTITHYCNCPTDEHTPLGPEYTQFALGLRCYVIIRGLLPLRTPPTPIFPIESVYL